MTHILVTRPQGQHEEIAAALQARGYQVTHQPALDIEPLMPTQGDRAWLQENPDGMVAVSVNAVARACTWAPRLLALPGWYAVGKATAAALAERGVKVAAPDEGFNSEALLALDALQAVDGQRWLVLAGEGGRDLIARTLAERGATVRQVALYRRSCHAHFRWPEPAPDVVMVTSLEGWHCIRATLPFGVIVLAGSQRIADAVSDAYTGPVVAAASPLDADMLAALETL